MVVRHAETTWNRERRMQGTTDTKLSDTGRAQAGALARRLADETFSALYSSDLSRARDTATFGKFHEMSGPSEKRKPSDLPASR